MLQSTTFLAKLIGVYLVVYAVMMVVNRTLLDTALNALLHDASQVFIWGSILAIAGIAFVLAHNHWSGGALTVIVTVIGWLTLLKGVMLLYLPLSLASAYLGFYDSAYYIYAAIAFVAGAWLAYQGWKSSSVAGNGAVSAP
ncbi:MAG: hypothetical protein JO277_09000 [Candidatus Eremiobacteraeota bacterium]|nr:hypothetical protein [Candidatus Eremiobacteraeota bacterium]